MSGYRDMSVTALRTAMVKYAELCAICADHVDQIAREILTRRGEVDPASEVNALLSRARQLALVK